MSELSEKLNHYTATVLSDATAETELALHALDARREAALTAAENDTLAEAFSFVKAQAALIRTEGGKKVSRHMLENQKIRYLRREEIAKTVFAEVREKIDSFTQSPGYPARLRAVFSDILSQLHLHTSIVLQLRPCDMALAPDLLAVAGGVRTEIVPGEFTLGGIIVESPAKNLRFDATFDSAMSELDGHFAELFGLSLSDDPDPAPEIAPEAKEGN